MTDPNVLLVVLDSVRARNTGLGGHHRDTTPFLDEFAGSATTYRQARAPAGRSLPSHASIFSGHLPQEHRLGGLGRRLAPGESVFADLAGRGYDTGLFTDNPYLADLDTGLADGFRTVVNVKDPFPDAVSPSAFVEREGAGRLGFLRGALASERPLRSLANGAYWTLKWNLPGVLSEASVFTPGFTYADRFAAWRRSRDCPWAACINLMDPHVPFRPRQEYDRWTSQDTTAVHDGYDFEDIGEHETWKHALLENRYDGTIRQADAVLEQVVEALAADGVLSETLVVVTADHGEGFAERDPLTGEQTVGHGDGVAEELLHVPLVVQAPGVSERRDVEEPVGLVDLPTAIDEGLAGDPTPFPTDRTVLAGGLGSDGVTNVAYRPHEEVGVLKYARGPACSRSAHLPDARVGYRLGRSVPDDVLSAMDDVDTRDVRTDASGTVDEDTQRRLAALGYTE